MTHQQPTLEHFKARAAHYCAANEVCRSAVRQKLYDWGALAEQIEPLLDLLESERYIDDRRYALAFTSSKLRYQHWGRIKITQQLRLKAIDGAIISEALATIDDDEYMSILTDLASKKLSSLHEANAQRLRKTVAYLVSRGFEQHLAIETTVQLLAQLLDNE